jgi:transcriptional regulator with XRE-family HTH domain
MTSNQTAKEIGKRLRLTREAMGLTQAAFCRKAGLSPSGYNQFEKGGTRPRIDSALALRDAHGLSLDWIYLGDRGGLSPHLMKAIKALEACRERTTDKVGTP